MDKVILLGLDKLRDGLLGKEKMGKNTPEYSEGYVDGFLDMYNEAYKLILKENG